MDALLDWLWQGIALAIVAALLLRLLDRARARPRYIVCAVSLLAIATLPLMPWLTQLSANAVAATSRPDAETPPEPITWSPAPRSNAVLSVPDAWWTSSAFILLTWAGWFAFSTTHASLALARVRRTRARTVPVRPATETRFPAWMQVRDTGRRPRLVVSADIRAAAVLGAGPPLIALSSSLFERLTDEEIDRLIMHEWAHIHRRDDWAALAQLAVRMVAGWHPAYRWIERRLQFEREIACDEAVVSMTGSAKAYAACLVKLASVVPPRAEPLMALAAISSPRLSTRVARIVSPARVASRLHTTTVATIGMASLLSLAIAIGTVDGVAISKTAAARPADVVRASAGHAIVRTADPAADVPPSRPPRPVSPSLAEQTITSANDAIVSGGLDRFRSAPTQAEATPMAQPPQSAVESLAPIPTLDRDPLHRRAALLSAPPEAANSSSATADSRTPWGAAADAGVAIGRGSKKAGVATAGFFSRVGRRIAGSF